MSGAPTKHQRLRGTADGFMAALVECGYRGPWRWSNLDWELPFYQVWNAWEPRKRTPKLFPKFGIGPSATTSQGREMLWQLKRTSPFHGYADEQLTRSPFGLTPRDFLEIWAKEATPDEWVELAAGFLEQMEQRGRLS